MKEIKINIFELIDSTAAVSSEDGEMLYKKTAELLKQDDIKTVLDFINVTIITSAFLNAAIGQLYNKYDSPFLKKRLKIENMEQEDLALLKKVVERAKEYFRDKEKISEAIGEAMEDE